MSIKRNEYEFSQNYVLEYDPESPQFKQALSDYKEVISSNGDEEEMLRHIVYSINSRGEDSLVEGVGYLNRKEEMWCGVDLVDDGDTDVSLLSSEDLGDVEEIEDNL